MNSIVFVVLFAMCMIPLAAAASPVLKKRNHKKMALIINIIACVLVIVVAFTVSVFAETEVDAEGVDAAETVSEASSGRTIGDGIGLIAAALTTGASCVGAGIAVSSSASAAIGAISENPKTFGKAVIFVALAEGVALYGMLISIQILSKI